MAIRIDALPQTVLPSKQHEIPAMKDGLTVKLTVDQILNFAIGDPPASLDTIGKLAAALGDDPNFALTMSALIGTKADATSVVRHDAPQSISASAQAQARVNISAPLKGHIHGLALSNNASDATNDIDIALGEAASDAATPVLLTLVEALTKRLDAAWAAGSGNGGLDTGSIGNNVYYVWLIQRSDTGVMDALFSLSNTSPTMPMNYDRKCLIGSFARVSAVNNAPRSYSQKEPTPWVSYLPTFTGVGTATAILFRSRRVGGVLEVEGAWTSGTVTGAEFSVTLGFNGTNSNVVCDTFWNLRRPVLGVGVTDLNGGASYYVIGLGGAGVVNISFPAVGRNGLTPVTGSTLGTGQAIMIRFTVPIEGWN